ncbi:MAG: M42 family peptidase [Tissierellia bacterium]|nr:M42 family peptidase [Tissierellia bacterium]
MNFKEEQLKKIEILSNAPGISGFEEEVVQELMDMAGDLPHEKDLMQNLYLGRYEGEGLKIMLDGHSDEVGFMVQSINDNGTLNFVDIGGWHLPNITAQRVQVRGEGGYHLGIVGSIPPHYLKDKSAGLTHDALTIDVGASSREEVLAMGIALGAPIVPDSKFSYDEERDLLIGKAFDNRLGSLAALTVLQALEGGERDHVMAAIATQEEVGLRGASVTARRLQPHVAISFEGCPADDTFTLKGLAQTVLGAGPMLRYFDSTMITHPGLQRFAMEVAKEEGIPVQGAVRTGGGTNAGAIYTAAGVTPTIVIGIPVRYAHTHTGLAKYSDYENAVKLGIAIVKKLIEEDSFAQ